MPDAKITNKPTGKIWHGPKLCKWTRSVEGETAGTSLWREKMLERHSSAYHHQKNTAFKENSSL
jgi:hypothetical protein